MYQKKLGPECWAIAKMGEQPKSFAMCTVCWMVTLQCIRDLCPTTGETGTGMLLVMGWMVYFQFRSLVLSQEDQVQDSSRHVFLVGQPRRSQCSWCATLTGQPDFRSPTSLLYVPGRPSMYARQRIEDQVSAAHRLQAYISVPPSLVAFFPEQHQPKVP